MNQQEIFNGLWNITKEKHDACKTEALSLDKNHPTERGALQLKSGIYNVAIAAGLISGTDHAIELMVKRFDTLIGHFFPDLVAYYNGLSCEEKNRMAVALYPEVFMRANFYNKYNAELTEAEKEGDPQEIFKARIKKEVLDEVLNMWKEFRVQNDLFVFAFDDKEEEK